MLESIVNAVIWLSQIFAVKFDRIRQTKGKPTQHFLICSHINNFIVKLLTVYRFSSIQSAKLN